MASPQEHRRPFVEADVGTASEEGSLRQHPVHGVGQSRAVSPQRDGCQATALMGGEQPGVEPEGETEVVTLPPHRRACRLVTTILAPDGAVAATAEAVAPVAAGERYTFRQELDVAAPAQWDLDTPNLYTAVSTLHAGDETVDRYSTRFGIRDVRMTPEQGLLLNGRKVVAKGGDLRAMLAEIYGRAPGCCGGRGG